LSGVLDQNKRLPFTKSRVVQEVLPTQSSSAGAALRSPMWIDDRPQFMTSEGKGCKMTFDEVYRFFLVVESYIG